MKLFFIIVLITPSFLQGTFSVSVNGAPLQRVRTNGLEERLVVRKQRLTLYFSCFVSWIDEACELTDEQEKELRKAIQIAIEKSQDVYEDHDHKPKYRRYLFDYSPIRISKLRGAADWVFRRYLNDKIKEVLDARQQQKWEAATKRRHLELHQLFLEHVLNKASSELLYFPEEKKQEFRELFPSTLPLLRDGLYSLMPRNNFVDEKSIRYILLNRAVTLSEKQAYRLRARQVFRQKHIMFEYMPGKDAWRERVDELVSQQKEIYLKEMDIYRDYISSEFQLNDSEQQYLKVAGKGTVIATVDAWKKKAIKQLEDSGAGMKNGNPKRVWLLHGLPVSEFEQNSIWDRAIQKVIPKLSYENRKKISQKTTAGYAAAILDQELWLSSQQRKKIEMMMLDADLINFGFTKNQKEVSSAQLDLALLGMVIHGKKQKELEAVLNETQRHALSVLKQQLPLEDSSLRIDSRHGLRHLMLISR